MATTTPMITPDELFLLFLFVGVGGGEQVVLWEGSQVTCRFRLLEYLRARSGETCVRNNVDHRASFRDCRTPLGSQNEGTTISFRSHEVWYTGDIRCRKGPTQLVIGHIQAYQGREISYPRRKRASEMIA
eukprot:TRINITY_DN1837_c0_g1_i4.p1 TRINITY_DN1837_c0_g1~~TRINITY_DN1837_c0_g1_i4.p1  ORF type:complete len:142 (+),score=9.30 TRINITY_DN1837_c0_g1_i4:39-428(+)